ncbi:MAG: phosphonate C-P lyase system protein PhnG [Bacillota bacterium]|nr:phosphonate C-P lyase system protein PhnG [Bacillota bacterium]
MNKKERTKIFIDYASDQAKDLARLIEANEDIEIIQEPKEGLAMIKVRETAKNSLFYLGEVLITETKVRIKDQIGLGIVKGKDCELSKALAILDAAYELNLPILDQWTDIFLACQQQGLDQVKKQRAIVAATKVDFETMKD